MQNDIVRHVFLVGAKSLGAYGGFETFVNKLTEYHQNNEKIKYHVACKANGNGSMDPSQLTGATILSDHEFEYHNAHCFQVSIPEKLGAAQAIYYDAEALRISCEIIKREKIAEPIVYIMACRIGPIIQHYYRLIHELGGKVYLNPDGHEFLRAKWSAPVRKYWRSSERMMVKWSDLVICDSKTIEAYIHDNYDGKGIAGKDPETTFIAYGAETRKSRLTEESEPLREWYAQNGLRPYSYYLVVGRFVPENNYETMIREFMRSHSPRDFVIITNTDEKFLNELEGRLHFKNDKRIKFVGTVYDEELLKKIRENAYAYLHGHEVGGTNPSLLEALGSTDLNLLLNVGFNKEVAENTAVYWTKKAGNLAALIDKADKVTLEKRAQYGKAAKKRICTEYSWQYICDRYEEVFLK